MFLVLFWEHFTCLTSDPTSFKFPARVIICPALMCFTCSLSFPHLICVPIPLCARSSLPPCESSFRVSTIPDYYSCTKLSLIKLINLFLASESALWAHFLSRAWWREDRWHSYTFRAIAVWKSFKSELFDQWKGHLWERLYNVCHVTLTLFMWLSKESLSVNAINARFFLFWLKQHTVLLELILIMEKITTQSLKIFLFSKLHCMYCTYQLKI